MVTTKFTVLAAAALSSFASAAPVELLKNSCISGLYMIVARGTNEPEGQGKAGQVADMVAARIPNSASVAVDYPATAFGGGVTYPESVTEGINDTKKKIQDYVAMCGDAARIVLIGFSQGANVMTDTLSGGILKPSPLSQEYQKYSQSSLNAWSGVKYLGEALLANLLFIVTAVTVFGDPAFASNQVYDFGSNADGPNQGIFSRTDNEGSMELLSRYSNVLASYCDQGDFYCARGWNPTTHGAEVPSHAQEATDFIVSHSS